MSERKTTEHQRSNESEGHWQGLFLLHQQPHKDGCLKDRSNSVEMIQFSEQEGEESKILKSLLGHRVNGEGEKQNLQESKRIYKRENQVSFVHSKFQVPMRPTSDEQERECG